MRTHCVWQKQVRTAVILMTNHLSDGVKHSLFLTQILVSVKFTTKLQNDSTARIKRNQTARLSARWPVIAFTTFSETSGISSSMDTHSIWMVTQCKALQHRESESEKKKGIQDCVHSRKPDTLIFCILCVCIWCNHTHLLQSLRSRVTNTSDTCSQQLPLCFQM